MQTFDIEQPGYVFQNPFDGGRFVERRDAEAEIEKARADERERILRFLDYEGFEIAARRLHLLFRPRPQEPKPLEKIPHIESGDIWDIQSRLNNVVDAVNELRKP